MAEATKKPHEDLVRHLALADRPIPLVELPKSMQDPTVLQAAWAAGLIEFGRANHCMSGIPGPQSDRKAWVVIIEDGFSWTGPKRNRHKSFKEVLADEAKGIRGEAYRRYEPDTRPEAKAGSFRQVDIKADEAERILRLHIRATDAGLATMAA